MGDWLLMRQQAGLKTMLSLTVGKHSVNERWSSLNQVSVNMHLIPTMQISVCLYLQFILRTNINFFLQL